MKSVAKANAEMFFAETKIENGIKPSTEEPVNFNLCSSLGN
jgi:hypothetical protein